MTLTEHYFRFKIDHRKQIQALAAAIHSIPSDVHWELVDEMKGCLGARAANDSSDSTQDQEDALLQAEQWVLNTCSDGGVEEDVAMVLWLKGGVVEGLSYLLAMSERYAVLPYATERCNGLR